jgi:hypothetical protein
VEIDPDSCDCPAFPRIEYCKHIAAVELYGNGTWPDGEDSNTANTAIPSPSHPTPSTSIPDHLIDPALHEPAPTTSVANSVTTPLIRITTKLQALVVDPSSSRLPPDQLQSLETAVDTLSQRRPILPSAMQGIPPNIKTATETARVLPQIKSKRKSEWGPYSGNERSGKKAKPDALGEPPATQIKDL